LSTLSCNITSGTSCSNSGIVYASLDELVTVRQTGSSVSLPSGTMHVSFCTSPGPN
jgi:hypothetical protein